MPTIAPIQLPQQPVTASSVQVKLEAPLPASVSAQTTVQIVSAQPNGKVTLQLPDGTQLAATLSPPLPVGSQINVSPPPTPTALQLTAQLPRAPLQQLPPTSAPSLPTPTPNTPTTNYQLPTATLLPSPLLSNFTPPPPPLPLGPVHVQIPPTTIPATIPLNHPLAGTITAPAALPTPSNPIPSQPAILTLPTTPNPTPVTIQAGQPLPVGTALTLSFPNPPTPTQPTVSNLLNITLPHDVKSLSSSQQTTPNTQPQTPPPVPPSLVKVTIPPTIIPSLQHSNTLTARVMAPPPTNPPQPTPQNPLPVTQPVLVSGGLANGPPLVVQSPHGIPSGSVLVIDINPLTGATAVSRVETPTSNLNQPQTQAGTTNIQTQTANAVLAPGSIVAGTVVHQNPTQQQVTIQLNIPPQQQPTAGQPLPATPQQPLQLTLQTNQPIPLGATLTVKIQPDGQAQLLTVSLPSGFGQSHALTTLSQKWDALSQALQTLSANNPALAASAKSNLPHVGNLMTLLPYIDATRTNVPERILGREATQILKAMGVDLTPDLSQLQLLSQPQQNQPDAWRGVLFPYIENPNDDPKQGGFFWRRQKKNDDERESSSTRFVVELNLSQMGNVQLDGLLSYPDLWLKLRRHTPSEPGFIEGLQTLVKTTLESLNLSGGISIETATQFDVNPLHDMLAQAKATLDTDV